jgi:hypothetical protein
VKTCNIIILWAVGALLTFGFSLGMLYLGVRVIRAA